MWPPFCLTTSCKRTLAFVTTFRHKSSESAQHNFTMWALSCTTFSGLFWPPKEQQFSSLWGLILYQMSNAFVIIKMCYVHNKWYHISCATLYIRGVIDCNEWKTEKCHKCTNMRKVKGLKLWWQMYLPHITSGSGLRKFQANGFLFDRVYIG